MPQRLDEIQQSLYDRALAYQQEHTRNIDSKDDFYAFFTPEKKDERILHGGFARSHFCGDREVEEQIAADLNVTLRCIPLEGQKNPGTCIFTGKPSPQRVVFAKAY